MKIKITELSENDVRYGDPDIIGKVFETVLDTVIIHWDDGWTGFDSLYRDGEEYAFHEVKYKVIKDSIWQRLFPK